jgi:hypothetical protein
MRPRVGRLLLECRAESEFINLSDLIHQGTNRRRLIEVVLIHYKDSANNRKTPAAPTVLSYCRQFADDASALGTIANDNPLSPLADFGHLEVKNYGQFKGRAKC